MLAAEANEAERSSEDTCLIPNPPSRTGRRAWITENHQGENYEWSKSPRREGRRAFLTEDGRIRVHVEGYVGGNKKN